MNRFLCLLAVIFGTMTSCCSRHFISDNALRSEVLSDFHERLGSKGDSLLSQVPDIKEREALAFLYAYMPWTDVAGHGVDFHKMNVEYSFKAREQMPWGKSVPEREFRHFVLPPRVNNEDLDSCRVVFFGELKDRVKDLTMREAILEVNHWCHEKVVYTPSDARTSSPLASVKTAYGRCGEESTFTVAALRAVGIPARQVYTPRWAHTDDNHAWVEAWADGKWYFFGACEPEPILNLGWFNAPASRGMMMNTRVIGKYDGPEEVLRRTERNTEINVTANYAPTALARIKVTLEDGSPASDAKVEFKLYNYAEFYTIATKTTDEDGCAELSTGLGDLLVWASKDGKFGYAKVSSGAEEQVNIVIDKDLSCADEVALDIVPPSESASLPAVTLEQRAENTRRMAEEDSIRTAYISTFRTEQTAKAFLDSIEFCHTKGSTCILWLLSPEDEKAAAKALAGSRGNHETIENFLSGLKSPEEKRIGLKLLQVISAKDLRDIELSVLKDNAETFSGDPEDEISAQYLLNPRVSTEKLLPFKAELARSFRKNCPEVAVEPQSLARWVKENIVTSPSCNLGGAPITPKGVWETRLANSSSRDIFYVFLCRSLGIPARIDEVTGKVQVYGTHGQLSDIDFEAAEPVSTRTGTLKLSYTPTKLIEDPKYYSHFTLARIKDDGTSSLLSYDEGDVDMGGGVSWANTFKDGAPLDEGTYMLTTGVRLANGGVLSAVKFFQIRCGQTTEVLLQMRESSTEVQVIGSFDSESLYKTVSDNAAKSILSTTGRGYFIVGILGAGQEPTNHALRDIAAKGADFQTWGRSMVLLFPDEKGAEKFNATEFPGLPSTIDYGVDVDGKILGALTRDMKLSTSALPVFIIADTFNRVVFVSQGYTIGLGQQLMDCINKL